MVIFEPSNSSRCIYGLQNIFSFILLSSVLNLWSYVLILELRQEIPYGLTVEIENYEDTKKNILIQAIIWVERETQKGIVVGKNGSLLKKVGTAARVDLKERLRKSIHLNLWVKVKANWADSEKDLQSLGYDL